MPYLSASAVVIHYEEALYQVYGPDLLPLVLRLGDRSAPKKIGPMSQNFDFFFLGGGLMFSGNKS